MNWEEIILHIRKDPSYNDLVRLAYFGEDLSSNVESFRHSEEFAETCNIIREYTPLDGTTRLLDVGAGNGIASVAFALAGCRVTAVEPDPSETVGHGAISILKKQYNLENLEISDSFGESLPFASSTFDVVYIRQAVHHAKELKKFMKESARVLRKGGLLVTVRDHVIFNEEDKKWFLEMHLLHRFYGGENAFTESEYHAAITGAGMQVREVLHHYDSIINYFPESREKVEEIKKQRQELIDNNLRRKLPVFLAANPLVRRMYEKRLDKSLGKVLDENKIPGRMISFFATKI